MKSKIVLAITVIYLTLAFIPFAFAEKINLIENVAPGENNKDDVIATVLESNNSRIKVRFDIYSYDKELVKIDDENYFKILCGHEHILLNKGEPALPRISRSVIIPNDAKMDIEVLSVEYKDYEGIQVAPSKGNLLRNVEPENIPYQFGSVYNTSEWYPSTLASIREPFILRDIRGTVIDLNAFQYNPVLKTLRVYTSVTLEVINTGIGTINVIPPQKEFKKVVPEFDAIYKRRFINYSKATTLYTPVEETGDMLIITYDDFADEMESFVEWKKQKGIPTTIVDVSTIGNNSTSIKSYVQSFYDDTDNNLVWLLLVGDESQVATPIVNSGGADPTYAKLAGGDYYPDIFVGRFSAETSADVTTQVNRTISYEQNPQGTSWFSNGTGIASNQGPGHNGEYDDDHMDLIRTDLLGYNYSSVDQIYDPGATATEVSTAINSGRGIVNYCGHGNITYWSTTGFSNTEVDALTNNDMLPFIHSVACYVGYFNDSNTCFGEAWLRATYNSNPSGAIAAYMSSISQAWNPPMDAQDETIDLLAAETKTTFGGICFNGACYMIEQNGSDGADEFNNWIIFGDPSVQLRTKEPDDLVVTHDGNVPVRVSESHTYSVQVQKSGGGYVEDALCALYFETLVIGHGTISYLVASDYTNAQGQVTLSFDDDVLYPSADGKLTVTAQNCETVIEDVTFYLSGEYADREEAWGGPLSCMQDWVILDYVEVPVDASHPLLSIEGLPASLPAMPNSIRFLNEAKIEAFETFSALQSYSSAYLQFYDENSTTRLALISGGEFNMQDGGTIKIYDGSSTSIANINTKLPLDEEVISDSLKNDNINTKK